jgi:geranylgeranyl pyrophosphate synthase
VQQQPLTNAVQPPPSGAGLGPLAAPSWAPESNFGRVQRHLGAVQRCMTEIVAAHCAEPLRTMLDEHLSTGGKRLRALLALAAAEALGASSEASVGWAAACELLHNGSLVHDDLQDGDEMRRGHPTLWFRHGSAHAINAGDLLLIAPALAIARVPADERLRWSLLHAVSVHAARIASGQAAELEMTSTQRADPVRYRQVVALKTSGLFELPVVGAALLAGHAPASASAVSSAFQPIGVLFQLQDDVLDLYGDKGRGNVGADLLEGKMSALVVRHLELHPGDRAWLCDLLGRPRDDVRSSDIEEAIARFRSGGALAAVARDIRDEAASARERALAGNARLAALVDELIEIMLTPVRKVLESCADGAAPAGGAG